MGQPEDVLRFGVGPWSAAIFPNPPIRDGKTESHGEAHRARRFVVRVGGLRRTSKKQDDHETDTH